MVVIATVKCGALCLEKMADLEEKRSSPSVLEGRSKQQISMESAAIQEDALVDHPLCLNWSFGFNSSLPVHNVSDGSRKMVFYVSSHVGVLFDCSANKQTILQGHSHAIMCTAVSGNRRWAVSADTGPQCSLIVWDTHSGVPVCTLFEGLHGGCKAVAFSEDAKYVAALSALSPQVLSLWDWSAGSETPNAQVTLNVDYGHQTHLTFHCSDSSLLVSNSQDTVLFYQWTGTQLCMDSTPVSDKDFNKACGLFSQTVYLPDSTGAISGTSEGCVVVWSGNEGGGRKPDKLMRIHDSHVTVLTTVNGLVVSGDNLGKVKFFDSSLKLLHWYDSLEQYGHLVSISFASCPLNKDLSSKHQYPNDSTMSAQPFLIPDFSTSSLTATITYTTANGSAIETVLGEHDGSVRALTAHPLLPRLAIGSYSCKLKLWDYQEKQVLVSKQFKEGCFIQCMAFDPKGDIIGVGLSDGRVWLLDGLTLNELAPPFHYSRESVNSISFSPDSSYLATADSDLCVTVYQCEDGQWRFLAKHRSHHKQIQDLLFGTTLDSTLPRLLSLGSDRNIVEYDLAASRQDDLKVVETERVEQSAIPTAMAWYPPLVKESFVLLSNDQYKLKLYNSTTKMCRKTLLGPTFGSPISRMLVLPELIKRGSDGEQVTRYLVYVTADKVGLLILPHNGNPHNTSCLLAHPGKVTDLCCSFDGRYVFTAGGDDHTVNMWATNTDALDALSLLGGKDLEPFYSLLEGGRDGEFFKELEEFFYYAQLRSQGVDCTVAREVGNTVSVEQVPDIMRAIGYYPSEEEIENMVNEVKFSDYVDSEAIKTHIDLGDLLKLYINHRPAFGLSPAQFEEAFKVLGQRSGSSQEWCLDRSKLLQLLQEKGEHLTETELVEYLMTLLEASDNPEVEGSYTDHPDSVLTDLPQHISATTFAEDMLGLTT